MPAADTSSPPPMTDIHDIKALENLSVDTRMLYYILAGVLVLAVIAATWHFWKKYRKQKNAKQQVPIPPHETALLLLDGLSDVETMDGKTFYFNLSAIVRNYIDGRFHINAPEMTTEELVPKIDLLEIDKALQQELKGMIRAADPVKFAGIPAEISRMREHLIFAREFINQTILPENAEMSPLKE
jgi:hypothetical protein